MKNPLKRQFAPNDPNRVPKAHRELINKIFEITSEAELDIFQSQHIVSAAALLCRVQDLPKAGTVLAQLLTAIHSTENAQRDIQAITEILNMKMTETMNKMQVKDLVFEKM
jgi:hypothetical protein